jgi:hypothetical protein
VTHEPEALALLAVKRNAAKGSDGAEGLFDAVQCDERLISFVHRRLSE